MVGSSKGSSSLSKVLSSMVCGAKDGRPRTINIFLGFFLMINIVLGTGFLSIPYGFYHSGVLPSIVTLLLANFITWLCAVWVVETMARAQAYTDYKEHKNIQNSIPRYYISTLRKFEPTELSLIFVGQWMRIMYLIVIVLATFIAVATYCTVAGSAWSVNIPFNFGSLKQCHDDDFRNNVFPEREECGNAYRFCVFIFGCIVIFLSILPLKEQLVVQVILGVLRFTTIAAIVVYCVVNLIGGNVIENCNNSLYEPKTNFSDFTSNASIPMFNTTDSTETLMEAFLTFDWKRWMASVAIFTFAFGCHPAIPALTHPIKRKEWLRGYFNVLYLTLGIVYMMLGLSASLWFKDCIVETCTLNWEPMSRPGRAKALRALSYIIILFPSIDVCSAFPLAIHVAVNNIYTIIFGRDTTEDKKAKFFVIQFLLKLMIALLPFTVAMFVANLVTIITYAGLCGFFFAFYAPIIWQIASQWKCYSAFSKPNGKEVSYWSIFSCTSCVSEAHHSDMINDEATPLIVPETKMPHKLLNFLTDSSLYKTPYSLPFLSSPIFVILVGFIAFSFLIFTIISLT